MDARLLGTWVIDPKDLEAVRRQGRVSISFRADGSMIYTIHGQAKDQVMLLRFATIPGVIVTTQPSEPCEERTPYRVTSDGKLVLEFGGVASRYVRV